MLSRTIGCQIKVEESSEEDSQSDEEETQKKSTDLSVPWPLDKDEKGWPVMPNEEVTSFRLQKDIFRSFMTKTYREFFFFFSDKAD